mmetsp:Transcript_57865/g.129759  ORF Transcript_57865/g.129759 Transcript_57865/m.129759 type:complete len:272 (-) Transcript_57865:55-870(-)
MLLPCIMGARAMPRRNRYPVNTRSTCMRLCLMAAVVCACTALQHCFAVGYSASLVPVRRTPLSARFGGARASSSESKADQWAPSRAELHGASWLRNRIFMQMPALIFVVCVNFSGALAMLTSSPSAAFAEDTASLTEMIDGGVSLPDGARQEDRLKRGLEAWKKLAKKVESGEVSDEDWSNSQGFLRRLYSLQDDMNYLARGLKADKRAKAEEIVTSFKKEVKAADKPAKAKEVEKFLGYYKTTSQQLQDYLELLVDVTEDLEFAELEPVE